MTQEEKTLRSTRVGFATMRRLLMDGSFRGEDAEAVVQSVRNLDAILKQVDAQIDALVEAQKDAMVEKTGPAAFDGLDDLPSPQQNVDGDRQEGDREDLTAGLPTLIKEVRELRQSLRERDRRRLERVLADLDRIGSRGDQQAEQDQQQERAAAASKSEYMSDQRASGGAS